VLEPTSENRALVNRGIAEREGYYEIQSHKDGSVSACKKKADHTWGWERLDYTRSLDACFEVCERRGWMVETMPVNNGIVDVSVWRQHEEGGWMLVSGCSISGKCTDLRWLVAVEVWEAGKVERSCPNT